MKYILFLLAILPGIAMCQTKRQLKYYPYRDNLSKKQERSEERNHNCMVTSKYSTEELRKFYPFDIASSVALVSFENHSDTVFTNILPVINNEIDYTQIKENKVLNRVQVDSLLNLFYNVTYRGKIIISSGTGCYNPRNAVLFFDSNNHLLEFIEICFECHEQRISSDKITIGDLCNQKSDMIKEFFSKQGIKVGTKDKRIE